MITTHDLTTLEELLERAFPGLAVTVINGKLRIRERHLPEVELTFEEAIAKYGSTINVAPKGAR
jgi:hypothetical protein